MTLEQELNAWRMNCLEAVFYNVKCGTYEAVKESCRSYNVAIDQHTVEYLNNSKIDIKNFYRGLK
jgi:hypothetical protein